MDFFSLKYKLLLFSVELSLALTLLASVFKINQDINTSRKEVSLELQHLEQVHKHFLSEKMWAMDYEALEIFAHELVGDRLIDSITITDHEGEIVTAAGTDTEKKQVAIRFLLTHEDTDREMAIGGVSVVGYSPGIREIIINRWPTIFVINGLLITIIFTSSYLLFYRQVLKRLFYIIDAIKKEPGIGNEGEILPINVQKNQDEISQLIHALNDRTLRIKNEFNKRLKAEAELDTSRQTLLTVLDSIDAMVYVSDMQTNEILFINRSATESFGKNVTGQKCHLVFRDRLDPCPQCTNSQLVDANGQPTGVCISQRKDSMTGKHFINHDRAIEWADGRLVRLQIATDISELIRIEEQLRQAQKMESVGRLAGGVAHDFNNMLGIIIGNAEILLEEVDEGDQTEKCAQDIYNAAKRSVNLTRQLLAFARKQPVSPRLLDLNETVGGMLKMLKRLIGENIKLNWAPDREIMQVKIDPTQVDQILANLIVNARDSINDIGTISIETANSTLDQNFCTKHEDALPGIYVCLSVTDSGHGMDADTISKLFEPFFTTKEQGEGTGLGLATVYGIVKQNNGVIDVQSFPGKGTTFAIYLPAHHAPENLQEEEKEAAEQSLTGQETILIVEDEPLLLQMTKSMLTPLGYHVLAARNPGEALEICARSNQYIDLLMSDVIMPEMNGKELAKRVKEFYPEIKCLFMSGYSADVVTRRGILDNDTSYLQKPFSRQILSTAIRNSLAT